jgi:hypothetical protein
VAQWTAVVVTALAVVFVLQACSSGPGHTRAAARSRARSVEDLDMRASDFHNILTMTKVRGFYVDNRLGHLAETLRVANSPDGGTYPVGTIIQLIPQEAMVKRRAGFDPATHDWEFFSLRVSAQGTTILRRGTTGVVNQFGGDCASCHGAARPQYDMVCEHTHGCAPLPIGDDVIHKVQLADPRPRTQ